MKGAAAISGLILSYVLSASAEPSTEVSGRAFTDLYVPTQKKFDKPLTQGSASLWLELYRPILEGDANVSGKLILEANAFDFNNSVVSGSGPSTHVESTIREGYLTYTSGGLEVTAGRRITPWGKADVVNPTDYLSAKNLSFFNPDTEVQRVGGAGIVASWTPERLANYNVTAVLNPYFAEGRFLIAPSVLPLTVELRPIAQQDVFKSNDLETALKASYNGDSWDVSVSGYRGYNHFPMFNI